MMLPLSSRVNKVNPSDLTQNYLNLIRDESIKVLDPVSTMEEIEDIKDILTKTKVILPLVCTGGVSSLLLRLSDFNKPLIILSIPIQNSLASALHAAILLKKRRKLFLLHHNLTKNNLDELMVKIRVARAISSIMNNNILLIVPNDEWLVKEGYDLGKLKELLGLEVKTIKLDRFEDIYSRAEPSKEVLERFSSAKKDGVDDEEIAKSAKVLSAIKFFLREKSAIAYGIRCFPFIMRTKVTPCLAVSQSIDDGIIAACEADLGALATMLLANSITQQPVFMGNLEDLGGNQIILAHCTVSTKLVSDFSLISHFETGLSASIRGVLKRGEKVTVMRLDNGFSKLFVATGKIIEGEAWSDQFCRTQFRVELDRDLSVLIEEPVSSHLVLVKGTWLDEFITLSKLLRINIV